MQPITCLSCTASLKRSLVSLCYSVGLLTSREHQSRTRQRLLCCQWRDTLEVHMQLVGQRSLHISGYNKGVENHYSRRIWASVRISMSTRNGRLLLRPLMSILLLTSHMRSCPLFLFCPPRWASDFTRELIVDVSGGTTASA